MLYAFARYTAFFEFRDCDLAMQFKQSKLEEIDQNLDKLMLELVTDVHTRFRRVFSHQMQEFVTKTPSLWLCRGD
jgi:hypothetical protein